MIPGKTYLRRKIPKGTVIFREGDDGQTMFMVQAGRVEISRTLDGEKLLMAEVEAGGVFGEIALLERRPRTADAVALEDTVVAIIPATDFEKHMRETDPLLAGMVKVLVQNLMACNVEITNTRRKLNAALGASAQSGNSGPSDDLSSLQPNQGQTK